MKEDFKDSAGQWVKTYGGRALKQTTHSGMVWNNMSQRCKAGGRYQAVNPSYVGCTMSETFSDFQRFTDWHVAQAGYRLGGYDLDKDLLGDGKLYGEQTCVLIPHALNTLFRSTTTKDSKGVYVDKRRGTFYSNITVGSKSRRIGGFPTEELASAAFKQAQLAELNVWHEKLLRGDYAVNWRVVSKIKILITELDKEING